MLVTSYRTSQSMLDRVRTKPSGQTSKADLLFLFIFRVEIHRRHFLNSSWLLSKKRLEHTKHVSKIYVYHTVNINLTYKLRKRCLLFKLYKPLKNFKIFNLRPNLQSSPKEDLFLDQKGATFPSVFRNKKKRTDDQARKDGAIDPAVKRGPLPVEEGKGD